MAKQTGLDGKTLLNLRPTFLVVPAGLELAGLFIESRTGFDAVDVEIKDRLDFGAKAIDWRGLFKNPGVTLS